MVQLTIAEKVKILNYLDDGHSEREWIVYFIDYAWKSATATCIRNCFAKAGFISSQLDVDLNNNLFQK